MASATTADARRLGCARPATTDGSGSVATCWCPLPALQPATESVVSIGLNDCRSLRPRVRYLFRPASWNRRPHHGIGGAVEDQELPSRIHRKAICDRRNHHRRHQYGVLHVVRPVSAFPCRTWVTVKGGLESAQDETLFQLQSDLHRSQPQFLH